MADIRTVEEFLDRLDDPRLANKSALFSSVQKRLDIAPDASRNYVAGDEPPRRTAPVPYKSGVSVSASSDISRSGSDRPMIEFIPVSPKDAALVQVKRPAVVVVASPQKPIVVQRATPVPARPTPVAKPVVRPTAKPAVSQPSATKPPAARPRPKARPTQLGARPAPAPMQAAQERPQKPMKKAKSPAPRPIPKKPAAPIYVPPEDTGPSPAQELADSLINDAFGDSVLLLDDTEPEYSQPLPEVPEPELPPEQDYTQPELPPEQDYTQPELPPEQDYTQPEIAQEPQYDAPRKKKPMPRGEARRPVPRAAEGELTSMKSEPSSVSSAPVPERTKPKKEEVPVEMEQRRMPGSHGSGWGESIEPKSKDELLGRRMKKKKR